MTDGTFNRNPENPVNPVRRKTETTHPKPILPTFHFSIQIEIIHKKTIEI
jgi:hypothetical protein